jgi:DNA-binding Lrp family transcriptional regulator
MKAFILINAQTGGITDVVKNLKHIKGVSEAYMTFGPYDIVSSIEGENIHEIGHILANQIQPIPGVIETLTCLVVD